jgi:hypothetical protein
VHQPHGGGPIRRQPGRDGLYLRVSGKDEVSRSDDARQLDAGAGRLGEPLVPHGLGEHRADNQVRAADPARGQALAVHPGDQRLDVLAANGANRLAADRRVDVSAQH